MTNKLEDTEVTRTVQVPVQRIVITDEDGDSVKAQSWDSSDPYVALAAQDHSTGAYVQVHLPPTDATALADYLLAWAKEKQG